MWFGKRSNKRKIIFLAIYIISIAAMCASACSGLYLPFSQFVIAFPTIMLGITPILLLSGGMFYKYDFLSTNLKEKSNTKNIKPNINKYIDEWKVSDEINTAAHSLIYELKAPKTQYA